MTTSLSILCWLFVEATEVVPIHILLFHLGCRLFIVVEVILELVNVSQLHTLMSELIAIGSIEVKPNFLFAYGQTRVCDFVDLVPLDESSHGILLLLSLFQPPLLNFVGKAFEGSWLLLGIFLCLGMQFFIFDLLSHNVDRLSENNQKFNMSGWVPDIGNVGAFLLYYAYIVVASLLLPGETVKGHPNPKRGPQLTYKIIGFKLTCLTIFGFILFSGMIPQLAWLRLFDPAYFAKHFWPLFVIVNIFCVIVSLFLYIKGRYGISILG